MSVGYAAGYVTGYVVGWFVLGRFHALLVCIRVTGQADAPDEPTVSGVSGVGAPTLSS